MLDQSLVEPAEGGLGYLLFPAAMTLGRLTGDWVVGRVGARRVLFWGGLLTVAGFSPVLLYDAPALALSGLFLIGLKAANLVPVLFSLAGRQTLMPPGLDIAAVTTTGYAAMLLGPAATGFVSHMTSLSFAFSIIAVLVAIVPISSRAASTRT